MTGQQDWVAAGAALAVALVAGLAEWRRNRRSDLTRVGWMPWRGLQVAAFFVGIVFVVFAVRS